MNEVIEIYLATRRLGFKPTTAWNYAVKLAAWNKQERDTRKGMAGVFALLSR